MNEGPDPERTEAYFVRADASQAEAKWAQLVARCESRLRTLLHFRLPPAARASGDAEDLMQEVWLEAARQVDRFEDRGAGSLQRWLAAILRFKLMHAGRRATRLPHAVSDLERSQEYPELFDVFVRTQAGVSSDLRRREREQQVRAALYELSEEHREVVLLRVYEGLSGVEIAEQIGVSPGTVTKRFQAALEHVARLLPEEDVHE